MRVGMLVQACFFATTLWWVPSHAQVFVQNSCSRAVQSNVKVSCPVQGDELVMYCGVSINTNTRTNAFITGVEREGEHFVLVNAAAQVPEGRQRLRTRVYSLTRPAHGPGKVRVSFRNRPARAVLACVTVGGTGLTPAVERRGTTYSPFTRRATNGRRITTNIRLPLFTTAVLDFATFVTHHAAPRQMTPGPRQVELEEVRSGSGLQMAVSIAFPGRAPTTQRYTTRSRVRRSTQVLVGLAPVR